MFEERNDQAIYEDWSKTRKTNNYILCDSKTKLNIWYFWAHELDYIRRPIKDKDVIHNYDLMILVDWFIEETTG